MGFGLSQFFANDPTSPKNVVLFKSDMKIIINCLTPLIEIYVKYLISLRHDNFRRLGRSTFIILFPVNVSYKCLIAWTADCSTYSSNEMRKRKRIDDNVSVPNSLSLFTSLFRFFLSLSLSLFPSLFSLVNSLICLLFIALFLFLFFSIVHLHAFLTQSFSLSLFLFFFFFLFSLFFPNKLHSLCCISFIHSKWPLHCNRIWLPLWNSYLSFSSLNCREKLNDNQHFIFHISYCKL